MDNDLAEIKLFIALLVVSMLLTFVTSFGLGYIISKDLQPKQTECQEIKK